MAPAAPPNSGVQLRRPRTAIVTTGAKVGSEGQNMLMADIIHHWYNSTRGT